MNKVFFAFVLFVLALVRAADNDGASVNSGDNNGATCSTAMPLIYPGQAQAPTAMDSGKAACGQIALTNYPGRWFYFDGDGEAISLDTCDDKTTFDTIIMVFTSCKEHSGYIQNCVTLNDDACTDGRSRVQFVTEKGTRYYVLVAGADQREKGDIYLSATHAYIPPAAKCTGAIEVTLNDFHTFTSNGNTTISPVLGSSCRPMASHTGGVWYHVKGHGESYAAQTCNTATDFNSLVEVYTDCDQSSGMGTTCLKYNDDACGTHSLVEWRTMMNSDYYIFVTGATVDDRGNFEITFETREPKEYGTCRGAIEVTKVPFTYTGSTIATPLFTSVCSQRNSNGVFFHLTNKERQRVLISTCESITQDDTVIDVYADCDEDTALPTRCVAWNDDYCGLGAAVSVSAQSDDYYVFVSGTDYLYNGINFTLTIQLQSEILNDQCWKPSHIEALPQDFSGNTKISEFNDMACDTNVPLRRGAWFQYDAPSMGKETKVIATTCNEHNILQSQLEVYSSCNAKTCTAIGRYDTEKKCTEVVFIAKPGSSYFVHLTAANDTDPGDYYHVDFMEASENDNSVCERATQVMAGSIPYRTEISTSRSSISYSGCSKDFRYGGWYKITGTGSKMVLSTCDIETSFDTRIELYEQCPNSTVDWCLGFNDDYSRCGKAAEMEFFSEAGNDYYVYVTGYRNTTGVAAFSIYDKLQPENSFCKNARNLNISSLPIFVRGYTRYSPFVNATCSNEVRRKGLWYVLTGTGQRLRIDTCSEHTEFPAQIEVYNSCDEDGKGSSTCGTYSRIGDCSPRGSINLNTQKGEKYIIFVSSDAKFSMNDGFFTLRVDEAAESPSSSSSSSYVKPKKSSNAAAVACGVIFGIIGFAAIVAVIVYLVKSGKLSRDRYNPVA